MDEFDAPFESAATRDVYTVARLNREVRTLLERNFGSVWLEGEISNLSRPASGHWYFSLKDDAAQVRCAMFRQRNMFIRFPVRDGLQVLVRARVGLYEPRGEFQLVVDHLEEAGEGALRRRFEQLKRKLADEGLFDVRHKQPIPRLPQRIGVITSPSGAAIRDVLSVLRRRFPAIPVLVYPTSVQGEAAPREIVQALALAGARRDCDVLILARGGGSLEDLQAFNDESVARALFACPIPVVCGVGHESDVSIADFVADERAPTPSGAAERVSPDRGEWLQRLAQLRRRTSQANARRLQQAAQRVDGLRQRLDRQHPGRRLALHAQRLGELRARLTRATRQRLERTRTAAGGARQRLWRASPALRLAALGLRLAGSRRQLRSGVLNALAGARRRLQLAERTLRAVGPLATLERGYAIVTDAQGRVLRDAHAVPADALIEARLARGRLQAQVRARLEDPEK
jgi:exodeoxyribonuclease VII large subunit